MEEGKVKFIKKSIYFLSLLLLLVIFLNHLYIKLVPRLGAIYSDYIKNPENRNIDFAFFGDSHIQHALNPAIIPFSFNFGNSGDDYTETYFKLKKILEKDNVQINNAVLEIDMHTFSGKMRNDKNRFLDLSFYSDYVPLRTLANITGESIISLWLKDMFPFLTVRDQFVSNLLGQSQKKVYLGWVNSTADFSSEDMGKVSYFRYKSHFDDANPIMIEDTSFNYFLKLLRLGKQKNINLIFIKLPVSREYYNVIKNKNIDIEDYYNCVFRAINSTIGDNYEVLDYHDLFFSHPEYFSDPDHLNYKGSKILTRRFYRDMIIKKNIRKN